MAGFDTTPRSTPAVSKGRAAVRVITYDPGANWANCHSATLQMACVMPNRFSLAAGHPSAERAHSAVSASHDMCRSILDDIISSIFPNADTDTVAAPCAVVPALAAAEDVDSACKSVLSTLVSKVADQLDPNVADEIKLENAVIGWLRKYANRALPSPSGEEAGRALRKAYGLLLKRPAFAKRLFDDRAALAGLMRLSFPSALRCIVMLLNHEPKFSETIVKTGKWKLILGMGASHDPKCRDDARVGLNVLASKHVSFAKDVLEWDGIVAFLARAFEDGWQYAPRPFDYLSDARKSQVWTSLLCKGVGDDAAARASARNGILNMVDNVVSETDQNKILTSDEIVAFLARAFEDSWKDAASVFDLLEDAKKSQVVTLLLCKGASDDATARARVRKGIISLINEASEDNLPKITAADEFVAFMARAFEDGWNNTTSMFDMLNDAKKIQVYLMLKKDSPRLLEEYRVCSMNPQAEAYNAVTATNAKSMDSTLKLYRLKVCFELENAFRNNIKQPHMDTLVKVATLLGLKGEPNDVLTTLAPHMKARIERQEEMWKKDGVDSTKAKQVERERALKRSRLNKACNMLLYPENRIKKQFKEAMPQSMLPPPPPTSVVAAAPAAPSAMLALPMASAAGPAAPAPPPALMPPVGQPASSAPLALPPPSPNSYLRRRVRPRPDCAKCEVARGTDPSVRTDFATDGGKGRARSVSAKRACPLAAHAINSAVDGVALLEQYERDHGAKLPNKKRKFEEFMSSEYHVERLGKPPSFAVSLYRARVNAALAVQGGGVKLNLNSAGYELVTEARAKDNYMGFMIV